MSGYCGKLLRIDLTAGEITTENLDVSIATKFIGGRGLGAYILSKEVDPQVSPLTPDNKLILATGPLTGTAAPTGARYMVTTKSPLTGAIACSNSGGFWGPELKRAGYDAIVIEGKSETPVYICIRDGAVEIRDAEKYWGKLVGEGTDMLREDVADPKARVLMIGPAGERLSMIASVMNDKARAAGRSGVGAVMGSKNLKAVVVRGTGKVASANEEQTKDLVKKMRGILKEHPITGEGLTSYGTAVLVNIINESGIFPTRNFQKSYFEAAEKISGETLAKTYLVKNAACFGCPIACGRVSKVDGNVAEGPEFETIWAYGADCGVDDLASIIRANNYCNEYGLDTISAGATIACAMELHQKGLIKPEELEGIPLEFGNGQAIVEWTRKMGAGEGFGAKLTQGSYRLAESYGVAELSMTVKKQELPAYDPRGVQGHGLSSATSNRGGCHVRGYIISPEILGLPEKIDPHTTGGKAVWAKAFQDTVAVIDSLGLCLFTSFALTADNYRDMFNAIVGEDFSTDELLLAGERIWNLERVFNLKAGISADQDTLPKRLLKDPIPQGPSKGQVHHLSEMLPEYYKLRGWDQRGVPTEAKLAQLGIA